MPLPDLAWGGVARIRGWNVSPMYKSIQTILSEDVSHLARLLSELEPLPEEDYEVETPVSRTIPMPGRTDLKSPTLLQLPGRPECTGISSTLG
jgi:hypothetical protein